MIDPGKLAVMTEWAARYGCTVQPKGQVGFGRPCVGILYGQSYVDTNNGDYSTDYECLAPPSGVTDAYHKHDCLAVLAHGEESADYDAALEQLYTWVVWLIENDYGVEVVDRQTFNKDGVGRQLELLMGGMTQARVVKL